MAIPPVAEGILDGASAPQIGCLKSACVVRRGISKMRHPYLMSVHSGTIQALVLLSVILAIP